MQSECYKNFNFLQCNAVTAPLDVSTASEHDDNDSDDDFAEYVVPANEAVRKNDIEVEGRIDDDPEPSNVAKKARKV